MGEFRKNGIVSSIENIAAFYDAGEIEKILYAGEEYIHGKTLKEFLEGKIDLCTRSIILSRILDTMTKVYEIGEYHGDLHSGNVMIRDDLEPVLIDFGTSILSGQEKSHKRDCRNLVNLCYER